MMKNKYWLLLLFIPFIVATYRPISDRLILKNAVYNDINIPADTLGIGPSVPDFAVVFGAGGIRKYCFDGGALTEALHGSSEIIHGYKEGTDIQVHLHLMPANTGTGRAKFGLEYTWANVTSVFPSNTTVFANVTAEGTAWVYKDLNFPVADGTGKLIESGIAFRVFRDPTDSEDTYTGDVCLIQMGIHYQIDTLGSATIESKF
jgi:hypothetical protein